MKSFDRQDRLLAIGLAALAGYVDAIGFLATGGFFVSFMSGNSTRLGVGIAEQSSNAAVAAMLIGSFLIGVIAGSLVARMAGQRHREVVPLALAALLGAAALLSDFRQLWPAAVLMAVAMGVENIFFAEGAEVRIGLTYMTGRLVKLGQMLAAAIVGEDTWGWVPHLLLWSGLLGGGAAGAFAFFKLGGDALWIAAGAALLVALIARRPRGVANRQP
ncbi:MAG: YoaK family protein [Sphingomonas sp.]